LRTEYRDFLEPLVEYIKKVNHQEFPNQLITVVVPEFVPDSKSSRLLHNQTAVMLLLALRAYEDVVVINVPYHLHRQTSSVAAPALDQRSVKSIR
jgi:hypothetical protein